VGIVNVKKEIYLMTHVHTLKELELELSFIKDKELIVNCRSLFNGKQLVFRNKGDSFQDIPIAMIYQHNDLRTPEEKCNKI
jgi:hypothetical protein